MYNYKETNYRCKVWQNLKMSAVIATILLLSFSLFSCADESQTGELFRPVADSSGEFYAYSRLDKVKLSEKGKQQAKQAWDSLSTILLNDSTTQGHSYGYFLDSETSGPLSICLTFDSNTARGPDTPKVMMLFNPPLSAPKGIMYIGSTPILCEGKSDNYAKYGMFSDSLGTILDVGLTKVINGEGIRFDTDRGATTKLSSAQIQHLKRTITAYQADYLLHSPLNNP